MRASALATASFCPYHCDSIPRIIEALTHTGRKWVPQGSTDMPT